MNNDFYYCYSPRLHVFLQEKDQRYICVGLNEKTLRKFWQYPRNSGLDALLNEWQANRPK